MNNNLNSTVSQWKTKKQLNQTLRNYQQLNNRMKILEMQRKKKVKLIQRKLQQHQRQVALKIHKSNRKAQLQGKNHELQLSRCANSQFNCSLRNLITSRIKTTKDQLFSTNKQRAQQIKIQKIKLEEFAQKEKEKALKQAQQKRNRVRYMQLESKQNIQHFWYQKLSGFQSKRISSIKNKFQMYEKNKQKLAILQNQQKDIIQKIQGIQQMELEVQKMIRDQQKMKGQQLKTLYHFKQ